MNTNQNITTSNAKVNIFIPKTNFRNYYSNIYDKWNTYIIIGRSVSK